MTPIGLAVLIPFLGACGVVATRKSPRVRNCVLVISGLVNLFLLVYLLLGYLSMSRENYDLVQVLFETLPGLRIAFHIEPLGLIFALTAGLLWPITSVYSIGYLNAGNDPHQTRFHALFCVAMGSAMGIAFAENLFTLFLFYEILTFSTWPLVTHSRTPEAVAAGRVYLGVLLTTSLILFLLAIVLVGSYGSGLSFIPGGVLSNVSPTLVTVLLLLFLFGIGKAAVMPFHRWLPRAMVAPAPVSALLHAVAVVKAGVFALLKISVYIFGFDALSSLRLHDMILWIPAITILLASVIAMRQDDLKARLAYSTISQLSYIVLGALMANQLGMVGGAMHITMHAFGKITLFFCAGAIMVFAGKNKVSEMNGLGRSMPWTFAAFFIAALSIVGLPPAGGVWSKWYLALATLETGQLGLLAVLMISSLLNVYYLLSIPLRAFFLPADEPPQALENRASMVVPLTLTAAVSVLLFFLADGLANFIGEIQW
ncbi:proton-conducting transporter membrane subunit [Candidatus Spongiihabitans sp.]|uniref:proton-conducting transporter transmembrane domain-containing protein n=1 Tax=Candidatus Spongiihabitans sp. TaxID=3101308 RepID=UPI003C7D02A6